MEERLQQSIQQRQQQRLLPLQVRYGRMLEMSGPELEDEVRQMLDDNPALCEMNHDDKDSGDDTFAETAEEMQLADYPNDDETPYYQRSGYQGAGQDGSYVQEFSADDGSLADYLLGQLPDLRLSGDDLLIARYIIGNLNENGYLERGIDMIVYDIEQYSSIRVDASRVREVLDRVRLLDPPGIAAVDLRECLSLQLSRRPKSSDVDNAKAIVDEYFDIFSLKHYQQLASVMNIDGDSLRRAVELIRSLNPKPGAAYSMTSQEQRRNYVSPDFSVDVDGDQLVVTSLNHIPELAIESTFTADAEISHNGNHDAGLFIRQKRDEAQNFIQLLHMRQTTLLRVVSAIVQLQSRFFLAQTGDMSLLRPMILRDVADRTSLDLSVISRATSGKYIATVSGVYPLKMFFNERFSDSDDAASDGSDVSAHAIQEAIRQLVDEEDKNKPLSDEALARLLHERGYDVARRTVAKYRERLGISVARLRRAF